MSNMRDIDFIGAFQSQEGALAQCYNLLYSRVRSGDALVVDTIFEIVPRIQRRLGSGLKIGRLRIFGHAMPGIQAIGALQTSRLDITTGRIVSIEGADNGRFITPSLGLPWTNRPAGSRIMDWSNSTAAGWPPAPLGGA